MSTFVYAWRNARRQLGVTTSIVLLLALGIGGIAAVFNPIYSTVFAPLPYPQPEQLVRIGGDIPLFNTGTSNFEHDVVLNRIFLNTAAYVQRQLQIRIPDSGKQLDTNFLITTEKFFETLGIQPFIGSSGCNSSEISFVVSHRFWRKELMYRADVIGSHILLIDAGPIPIVGVMPEGFNFPIDTDIWRCSKSGSIWSSDPVRDVTHFIGRLRSGISYGRAAEELKSIDHEQRMAAFNRRVLQSEGPVLQSLQIYLYGDKRPMLRMLGMVAILFLALVCTGVINLLMTNGVKRKQDIAMRLVFGATRRGLVFKLLVETLPLVIIGGLAGWWFSEIASAMMWLQLPSLRNGAVAAHIKVAFWAVSVLVVTLISGLIPSLYATSLNLNTYLKSASEGKRRFLSAREFLVGVQLGIALALLIGMGVLIRSMMFNVDIPIGLSSRDVAVVTFTPTYVERSSMGAKSAGEAKQSRLNDEARRSRLHQDIQNKLREIPETMSVGIITAIPFSKSALTNKIETDIYKNMPIPSIGIGSQRGDVIGFRGSASSDGFSVLGIPFISGRPFTELDIANWLAASGQPDSEHVTKAIINQALAKRLWPGENAIGNVFYDERRTTYEVVGIVRNFHHVPGNRDVIPAMYVPNAGSGVAISYPILVKLRPNTSLQSFHSNVRQSLSGFPLDWVETQYLNEYVKEATMNQRLTLQLLAGFAVLGIIVAALAVYATATLAAAARTKEMGIRMAVGAQKWDILKLAFGRGIRAILLGLPFGLFLALILCKVLSSFLVQVNIRDPFVWLAGCAVLIAIAAIAALIPALRAVFLNPLDALRNE